MSHKMLPGQAIINQIKQEINFDNEPYDPEKCKYPKELHNKVFAKTFSDGDKWYVVITSEPYFEYYNGERCPLEELRFDKPTNTLYAYHMINGIKSSHEIKFSKDYLSIEGGKIDNGPYDDDATYYKLDTNYIEH